MPHIFHFTDVSNLVRIAEADALQCHRSAPMKVEIGNTQIKANRQLIEVGCGPGGKVCDYVPFYFAPRSPMLFSIKCGNVDGVDPDQSRLAYLVSSTEATYEAELDCVFSDGNAAVFNSEFRDDPDQLATHVDWAIMKKRYWRNTDEDGDRVRRRMAEFLVHGEVPIELIPAVCVRNRRVQEEVRQVLDGVWDVPVTIRGGWYF